MALAELSKVLWRERHLLERLIYKLEEVRAGQPQDRARWMVMVANEVEDLLDEIAHVELVRAIQFHDVRISLSRNRADGDGPDAAAVRAPRRVVDLGPAPSLRALADAAPEPWRDILHEHRDALIALMDELRVLADGAHETLGPPPFVAPGKHPYGSPAALRAELQRIAHEAVLFATARAVRPSLADVLV